MSNEDTTRDDSGMNEPRREHNCMGAQMKNWTKGCCMHVLVGTCWYSTVYFCSVGKTKLQNRPPRQRESLRRAELQRGAAFGCGAQLGRGMRDDDEGSDSGSSGIVGPVVSSIVSRGDQNATFVKEMENQHLRDLVLGSVGAVGHRCTREDTLCASLPAKVQYRTEGSGDVPGEDEPASIAGHNARAAPVAGDAGVELGVEQPDGQRCDGLKWMSLVLLVVQNAALFLIMRFATVAHPDDHFHSTVVVVVVELAKLLICYVLMAAEHESGAVGPLQELWKSRRSLRELTLPALCYTGQNNLLFVAVSFLSASASQVLSQTKVLWTAVFARALMHTKDSVRKWASFLILMVGAALVQGQDRKSMSSLAGDTSEYEYMLGVASALGAAVLSGLGGILLEMNYTSKRSGSLLLINMQLSLVSLPFALLAVFEFDWPGIAKDGWHKGLFRADTMAVILVQVCALRALLLMAPDGS